MPGSAQAVGARGGETGGTARPSAPPIMNAVLTTPDARPASCGATSLIAASRTELNAIPAPKPSRIMLGRMSTRKQPPRARARRARGWLRTSGAASSSCFTRSTSRITFARKSGGRCSPRGDRRSAGTASSACSSLTLRPTPCRPLTSIRTASSRIDIDRSRGARIAHVVQLGSARSSPDAVNRRSGRSPAFSHVVPESLAQTAFSPLSSAPVSHALPPLFSALIERPPLGCRWTWSSGVPRQQTVIL